MPTAESTDPRERAIIGCLLGTAVGDALGLAYEGLSRRRAAKMFGPPDRYRFFFRRGMVSDDTEHACLVAQSLIASAGNPEIFLRELARRFRYWLVALPAGIGIATLKAGVRLWLGFSPKRSGVYSAGNGAAMRSAILGVCVDDLSQLKELVRLSSRMTHTDPRAEQGALVVALAAHMAARESEISARQFLDVLNRNLDSSATEMREAVERACRAAETHVTVADYLTSEGFDQRVTGFVMQTVPVAIFLWLTHPRDFQTAIEAAIKCSGDTDTLAAIVGGIIGGAVGEEGIPNPLLTKLWEWPASVRWMRRLGRQLSNVTSSGNAEKAVQLPILAVVLRNLFFLIIVLFHGFRRLTPPY